MPDTDKAQQHSMLRHVQQALTHNTGIHYQERTIEILNKC